MELRDPELFERKIYAKQFQAPAFRAELRRLKSGDTIWIGTATDPYQPAERRFQVTQPDAGGIRRANAASISASPQSRISWRATPQLMARIARKNRIRVHLTITTLDERLARLIEPRAPRPALRLAAVQKLTDAGVPVSVLAHPVMPLINDSEESLDSVCAAAARNGASSFSAAPLFLKPCAARVFLPFLEERFPHLVRRYRERYEKAAYLKGHYPEMIAERVEQIRTRHKIAARHAPEWPPASSRRPTAVVSVTFKGPGTIFTLQRKVNRL